MDEDQKSIPLKASACFPVPPGAKFLYGTAGFRVDALVVELTVYRAGILAALRSLQTRSVTDLVIIASHNKIFDNGVKITDPSGGMLTQEWEPFVDALSNVADFDCLLQISLPPSLPLSCACNVCMFCQPCEFIKRTLASGCREMQSR